MSKRKSRPAPHRAAADVAPTGLAPASALSREELDALFAARNVQQPDAPTEPNTESYTPALGDNENGLAHQIALAHAPNEKERARVLKAIEHSQTRRPAAKE